jgi:hypothetical protein
LETFPLAVDAIQKQSTRLSRSSRLVNVAVEILLRFNEQSRLINV